MLVCSKHFFEQKNEVEVSKNLYLMQYETEMRVVFRTRLFPIEDDISPVYFVVSEKALRNAGECI